GLGKGSISFAVADRVDGGKPKRSDPPARPMISARTSYRLDNRHCTGGAKDSGEYQVALRQRKTTAPNCEQCTPRTTRPSARCRTAVWALVAWSPELGSR